MELLPQLGVPPLQVVGAPLVQMVVLLLPVVVALLPLVVELQGQVERALLDQVVDLSASSEVVHPV